MICNFEKKHHNCILINNVLISKMNNLERYQEKHTVDDKVVGFDYQFYYFVYLALNLKNGDKIGFEIKDDIHIDMSNGTTILYQAKHTVLTKKDGSPENLTTLDIDLWKTISNWCDMIKSNKFILENYEFCLVTNKSENNNEFIDLLERFKKDTNIDKIKEFLGKLEEITKNIEIKSYIKNILSISKKKIKQFLLKIRIETSTDDIINKIKNRIYENCHQKDLVDTIFDSLLSNLSLAKYFDIKNRNKFEITFDDFNNRFGKCFRVAFENKPLPKRNFQITMPDNLYEQIFIKQLLDIEDIVCNDQQIVEYTTYMLQSINNIKYWIENNFIVLTEIDDFHKEAIIKWYNEFRSKYRLIERQIKSGYPVADFENEIKELGTQLVDLLRKENLSLNGQQLGIAFSNGYFYALSNTPEIGWHYNWEQKYKSI